MTALGPSRILEILLVDDDPDLVEGLLRRFRAHRADWRVATASTGVEALRLAGERAFDLLVTDILMPEKDGIETILAFQQDHPTTKVVAMSGGGRNVDKQPLRYVGMLGADATLEKPFEFEALLQTIHAVLPDPPPDITQDGMRRIP